MSKKKTIYEILDEFDALIEEVDNSSISRALGKVYTEFHDKIFNGKFRIEDLVDVRRIIEKRTEILNFIPDKRIIEFAECLIIRKDQVFYLVKGKISNEILETKVFTEIDSYSVKRSTIEEVLNKVVRNYIVFYADR